MKEIDDKELIHLFQTETERAFSLLVSKYKERLYWHIRRMVLFHEDADDVLQNTFIKVFKALGNFRHDSQLYTWLYRIASNETITFLNKKKKQQTLSMSGYEQVLADKLENDVYFSGDEIQRKLQMAIQTLPEKQRLVFNMKYYDEMKYEEMAEVLETSVGSLKASYHHAVKKIENYIKGN